ncbi:sh3 domain containing protein [Sporothrix brasiliensis 5110]|uniref:Sh3 domain containing protein n=1 Tax=Sporothrix brasiliensis 5110 TaxID=1398154 RepID=A0A0C2F4X6_9PEZI|nr:sh3 domain containing protein [Sporothrix brasiliensis 5110]KIH93969.1 sh3 domain containing protein [Sporothrix brasiliensis 5110]
MDEEIDFLLLGPFAEIVEKAQAALDTAQDVDNQDMAKAAQALLKEGERARKALEPIAKRNLTLYGENFVTALRDHDGVAEHIDALNSLVYVFDDYTEPDSFDADKFKELGKTAQQTTLRITPILRRMKLEAPAAAAAVVAPGASTPSTPLVPQSSPFFNAGVSRVNSLGGYSATSYSGARSPGPDDALDLSEGSGAPGVVVPSMQRYDTVVHVPADAVPLPQQREDAPPVMGTQGGPDMGWNNGQPQQAQNPKGGASPALSRHSIASPTMLPSIPEPAPPSPPPPPSLPEPPPPVPGVNPWQIGERPSVDTIAEGQEGEEQSNGGVGEGSGPDQTEDGEVPERRRRISTRPDSPTLPSPKAATAPQVSSFIVPPPPPPTSSFPLPSSPQQYPRRLDDGVDAWQQQMAQGSDPSPRTMPVRPEQLSSPPVNVPVMSATWSLPSQQPASGQNYVFSQQQQQQQQQQARQSLTGPTSAASGYVSPRQSQISNTTASTASSTNGSVFSFDSYLNGLSNQLRDSSLDPISPVAGPATAVAASPNSPASPQPQLLASFASGSQQQQPQQPQQPLQPLQSEMRPPPIPLNVPQAQLDEQPGLEPIHPVVDIDQGLIPVESSNSEDLAGGANEERVVQRRTADCKIGPGSSYHLLKGFCEGAREVQRGHAGVRQIKKLRTANANYRMHGIGFRLRFLSKCHLPAKQVDDPLYACIFCLQEGRTLEESDATVFFTQGQLFSHLARHPRPLPEVSGVTVIDGPERPEPYRNDYDLHFTTPPVPSELDGIRRELLQLPTAVATETFRKAHNALRRPFDGAVPIQFPVGSKIVGVEFPAKYKGEWAVGWFDNVRGPFPVEHIRLDPPPRNEIRTQGTSALRATARWKWASSSAYRNSEWLKLDRNETVTNIIWSHPEHWCWAGTNARGKWGYFPQSHIEPNSLKEGPPQGSDAASILSQERGGGGGGFLSRLRSHNAHNNSSSSAPSVKRPVSIASQSTSSTR